MKTQPVPIPSSFLNDTISVAGTPSLTILTGTRGAGKTRWCFEVATQARAEGFDVAGVICPPVFEGQEKTGIDILDLRTNQRRRLAERVQFKESSLLSSWAFNESALGWGNEILRDISSCDLLILDEMGPLEFNHSQGLKEGFDAIANGNYRSAIVVVRPKLVPLALAQWSWSDQCFLCITQKEED